MCEKNQVQEELPCYLRVFSELGEFQKAHTITYQLKPHKNGYAFVVERQAETVYTEQITAKIAKAKAEQLLALLYENAVSIEIWRDVLAEYGVCAAS